jgi:cytochrome c-type biogenesis protein CcmF
MLFVMAILVNGEIVYRHLRKKKWEFGGYLAHVGIGFMMIGIITSSAYDKTDKISLPLGTTKTIMGYEMMYKGFRVSGTGKDVAIVDIKQNGEEICEAQAQFYWSEFNKSYMRNPSVHNLWIKDLYISPIQIIPAESSPDGQMVTLMEDKKLQFEDYSFEFSGYEMNSHDVSEGEIHIEAIINVQGSSGNYIIKPAIHVKNQTKSIIADVLPQSDRSVAIQSIDIDNKAITLIIHSDQSEEDAPPIRAEMLAIEITEKPLINLLWFGTFMMIFGLVVSIINRVQKKE